MLFSCSQIKTAVNMATNSKDLVPKYPSRDIPRDMRNAVPVPQLNDEKTIIVTSDSDRLFYVGMESYPIEALNDVINKRLAANPSASPVIYLNSNSLNEMGMIANALNTFRKSDVDNVGLVVGQEGKNSEPHVLKIKLFPEPRDEKIEDVEAYKYPVLMLQKNGNVNFAKYDKDGGLKPEKPEIKQDEGDAKIQQLIKEKGATTIAVKAARTNKYVRVAHLIDYAAAAGATTIYLIIDDMVD
jgi:biopolymer transport protein ExbD